MPQPSVAFVNERTVELLSPLVGGEGERIQKSDVIVLAGNVDVC